MDNPNPLFDVIGAANLGLRRPDLLGGSPGQSGWQENNLTTILSPSGAKFRVNKAAASSFQGFINELEGRGYKINPNESGGYNFRNIAGSNKLSEHAFGNAVDINWNSNPLGSNTHNFPDDISKLAAKYRISWGGDWKTRKDPMHFEWAGPGENNQLITEKTNSDNLISKPNNVNSNQNAGLFGNINMGPLELPEDLKIAKDKVAEALKEQPSSSNLSSSMALLSLLGSYKITPITYDPWKYAPKVTLDPLEV